MHQVKVKTVYQWLDQMAPFMNQEGFDNAGFQLGSLDAPVQSILLALDLTEAVIEEAVSLGSELIITHHPLLFVPQRSLDVSRPVPHLISLMLQYRLSLIATHTNIDRSFEYSASAAVAKLIGLKDIRQYGDYLFIGELPQPTAPQALADELRQVLGSPVRQYQGKNPISTLAVAGGAYSEGYLEAYEAGAQALLTGEVRHHHAVEAVSYGITLFDGGHYATEAPMLQPLAIGLQKMANAVKYPLQVHVTRSLPYRLQ